MTVPHDHDHDHDHAGWWGRIRHGIAPLSHDAADSIDSAFASSERGIRAVKVSLVGLMVTAVLQLGVVAVSGSVALLADTIHNFSGQQDQASWTQSLGRDQDGSHHNPTLRGQNRDRPFVQGPTCAGGQSPLHLDIAIPTR